MAETKDFNARYSDPTPITGEVLERLGFNHDGYGLYRMESTYGTLKVNWPDRYVMWTDSEGRYVYLRYPVHIGDLLRLCDSLGVEVEGV